SSDRVIEILDLVLDFWVFSGSVTWFDLLIPQNGCDASRSIVPPWVFRFVFDVKSELSCDFDRQFNIGEDFTYVLHVVDRMA
ncbi:hypothetical protein M3M33_15745, partial [Loigolactobacillus coryniformis]|uniref:hypothetical protein n=1 Tax=Loigolactobacillus coryniformis TaxID=1610 RepID=UPI00201A67C2